MGRNVLDLNLPTDTVNVNDIQIIENALRHHGKTKDGDEQGHIISLAENIASVGILAKLSLAPTVDLLTGDKYFRLADGARRLAAIKYLINSDDYPDLTDEEIVCTILPEDITDEELLIIQIKGNKDIKDTTDLEFTNALYRISVVENLTNAQLAERMDLSEDWVGKLMLTVNLPKEARELLSDGKMGITNAINLSRHIGKIDLDFHEEVINRACSDITADFSQFVNEFSKEAKKIKEKAKNGVKPVYEATAKFIGKTDLATVFSASCITVMEDAVSDRDKHRHELLLELFEMDEESITPKRIKWEETHLKSWQKSQDSSKKQKKKALEYLKTLEYSITDKDGKEVLLPPEEVSKGTVTKEEVPEGATAGGSED